MIPEGEAETFEIDQSRCEIIALKRLNAIWCREFYSSTEKQAVGKSFVCSYAAPLNVLIQKKILVVKWKWIYRRTEIQLKC